MIIESMYFQVLFSGIALAAMLWYIWLMGGKQMNPFIYVQMESAFYAGASIIFLIAVIHFMTGG